MQIGPFLRGGTSLGGGSELVMTHYAFRHAALFNTNTWLTYMAHLLSCVSPYIKR